MEISAWLRGLGLERYERAFRENGIDDAILPTLTAEDLRDLGVTAIGMRRAHQSAQTQGSQFLYGWKR